MRHSVCLQFARPAVADPEGVPCKPSLTDARDREIMEACEAAAAGQR